ncbi:MAG TPA: AI-2E family transporter [Micromonosporaceae bacterium]
MAGEAGTDGSAADAPRPYGRPGQALRLGPFLFGLIAAAGVLVALATALGVRRAGTILVAIVVAGFLSVGLDRPISALQRRGMRRAGAYAIVVGALVLVLCGGVGLIVPPFANQLGEFFTALPHNVDQLMSKRAAEGVNTHTDLSADATKLLTPQNLAALASGVIGGLAGLAGALFFGITTLMLTLLMLWRLPSLKEGGYRLVVASRRERVRLLTEEMLNKIGSYMVGAVLVAACAGIAAFLWTYFAGVSYPLLMAVLVAGFDLIPQIGATLGSTIVTLTAWTSSFGLAVATLAFFCAYQGLENWIVYPRVMSRAVKISNLAAIIAALLGGAVFGVLGVLLAVPVYASVQLLVREVLLPRQDAR